jgi:hypothetical protein
MRMPLISASPSVKAPPQTLCNSVKIKLMRQGLFGSSPAVVRRRQRHGAFGRGASEYWRCVLLRCSKRHNVVATESACLSLSLNLQPTTRSRGRSSVTIPEVSCLVESVRYWLKRPTALALQESRSHRQHIRSMSHLLSVKVVGRPIEFGLIPKCPRGSLK